jgi:hypothetical protein
VEFRGYSLYDPGAYPEPPLSGRITWRVTNPWVGPLDEKESEAQRKAKELMERLRKRASDTGQALSSGTEVLKGEEQQDMQKRR